MRLEPHDLSELERELVPPLLSEREPAFRSIIHGLGACISGLGSRFYKEDRA